MKKNALGIIDTKGYVGAVVGADVCTKAANVKLTSCEKTTGGLVTVEIRGDVGAVTASINAASSAIPKVGNLVATHVIPRPSDQLERILGGIKEDLKKHKETGQTIKRDLKEPESETSEPDQNEQELREKLWDMKVVELRSLARDTENIAMTNNEIKFARKAELVDALAEANPDLSDE
ncbi:BMC domain-containing protein [Halanaerobium hydrogeniformans]|uniref:Microcompartments protein n=1 Tax=Halanaerobium hydrogeniformans TaxID=656519 RepID=E4RJS5_HALHG|nr:BMC domain-containing protein [Halanaerobium hydrogeniformans]ADQ15495.1 microcompartments protein [Halanaerobium hydrogeniformans]